MPRVVVVGASFAGLYAAKGLRSVADVVLIDASDEWEYTPAVHEVLGGQRKADTILTSLKDVLPGVEVIRGVAVAAAPRRQAAVSPYMASPWRRRGIAAATLLRRCGKAKPISVANI